jgi:hypothetical protein
MRSRIKNLSEKAKEAAKTVSASAEKLTTSTQEMAKKATAAAKEVSSKALDLREPRSTKFDSDFGPADPNFFKQKTKNEEYNFAEEESLNDPSKKKKKKKKVILIEDHPTTELVPEDKINPVDTQIQQPINAPPQSTIKNLKERLSKSVGTLSSHLKIKQNKNQKSTEDLIKIANLLLKKKDIKNAFKYFDAIQERGVKINIPKIFSPKIAKKYFLHVITEKNDDWLKKHIEEKRFLEMAVPFIARHNNSNSRKLETIRSKCKEIAKRNPPDAFNKFLGAPTTDPKELKIVFGEAFIKEHIANEILNYITPLIRGNPEMFNKAIEEAKKFLNHNYKYHRNYCDDVTDKDITDLIIQQQKEREDRRQSEIPKADSFARDNQKARQKSIDQKVKSEESNQKKQAAQAEQQRQQKEKEEKEQLSEQPKASLKTEKSESHLEYRKRMWNPETPADKDRKLREIIDKAKELEHLEKERRQAKELQQAQNPEKPQPPNAEPAPSGKEDAKETRPTRQNNLEIQEPEQNKKDIAILNSLAKSIRIQIEEINKKPNENWGKMMNVFASVQDILTDQKISAHERVLRAGQIISEIDADLSQEENYDKFSHWHDFGKEAIAILKEAEIPVTIAIEDHKAKVTLDILKTSLTAQKKILEHKEDTGSRKTVEALKEVQNVLDINTLFLHEKLKAVGKMIKTVDKNLRQDINYPTFSNWHNFDKVATAALGLTAIGAVAMGITQKIYGTHKFWSRAALQAGQARKSLQKLNKQIDISQQESPENSKFRPKK